MVGIEARPLPTIQPLWVAEGLASNLAGPLADAVGVPIAIPPRRDRPTIVANFVSTLDGVVSYATPEAAGGGEISGFLRADRLLMAALRGLADAVLVGAGTVRAAPGETWTPDDVYPEAARDIAALRSRLGLAAEPTTVVVTGSGNIDLDHPGLRRADVPVLIATTHAGAERVGADVAGPDVAVVGDATVEPAALVAALAERGASVVVCEGGPHLLGGLLAADVVDELFVTLAPQIAGRSPARPRLAMVEGVAFGLADAPWWRLVSAARSGDHLFMRYRRDRGAED